ncbi:DUF2730 family protein [Ancylobacter pratisalsi]|uniref:DUF2730 family protein n=1 Tax=Ancylobacter pratisalsi TaxID=1745854 RepID=A0A6P1YNX7_9HYPH|nr:DUF2730 family protein [Ancylobacter pratisalsi]QIB34762.1 DUF2730 family protein [Ancylobacter pratisalsi]
MEEIFLRWGPLLVASISLIFSISSARSKAAVERMNAIEAKVEGKAPIRALNEAAARIDALEDRTSRLEGEMRHMPSRDQTHELALALREMKGELGVLAAQLKPISHTTERLQEFLIDEAKARRVGA